MRVLALDTTTRFGSVAIVDNDRVIVERSGDPLRAHAESLPAVLMDALRESGLGPFDVDVFAVGAGPGSFTGLRIGIAAIQGMATVTRKPVVPVSILLASAEAASLDLPPGAHLGVWIDAYRRDVFSALYRAQDQAPFSLHHLIEIEGAAVGEPGAVLARWAAEDTMPEVVSGDGAIVFQSLLAGKARAVDPHPLAGVIGRIAAVRAAHGEAVDPRAVRALYVRRPDVEVARDRGR
jgi:tRNA threonylcarbamoyladenosine biosynthesis protein TsaB